MEPVTSINQKEYLKKYLSSKSERKKKRKKKSSSSISQSKLAIVDDDIDINNMRILQEDEVELYNLDEDAPQIVGIIDERPKDLQAIEDFRSSKRWKVVATDADLENIKITDNSVTSDIKILHQKHESISSNKDKRFLPEKPSDSSDPAFKSKNSSKASSRKYLCASTDSINGSDADVSPPRKTALSKRRGSPLCDKSKKKHSDYSLHDRSRKDFAPQNKRSCSYDSDASPPRVSRENNSDISPPRASKSKSSSFILSKKSKKKYDSDSSPPRISKDRYNLDESSDRKKYNKNLKKQEKYLDNSPPRMSKRSNSDTRKHDANDSDPSPSRRSKKKCDSDTSPIRKSGTNDSDISPPRKSRRGDHYNDFQPRTSKKMHNSSTSESDNNSDASVCRKRRKSHMPDILKFGQSKRKYDSDASPPRILKEKYKLNESSERMPKSRYDSEESPPGSHKVMNNSSKTMKYNKDLKYKSSNRHGTYRSSETYGTYYSRSASEQSRKFHNSPDRSKSSSNSSHRHDEGRSSKLNKTYKYDKKYDTKNLSHDKGRREGDFKTHKGNSETCSKSTSTESSSSESDEVRKKVQNKNNSKRESNQQSRKNKFSTKMYKNQHEDKIYSQGQSSTSETEPSVKKKKLDSNVDILKYSSSKKISAHRILESNTKDGNSSYRTVERNKGKGSSRILKKRYESDNHDSSSESSSSCDISSDSSPSRDQKSAKHKKYKKSSKSKKSSHDVNNSSEEEKGGKSNKMKKTLDGKQAGLQRASELKSEIENSQKREAEVFSKIGDSVSGRNAKTIIRDRKTGKQRDLEEEARQQEIINEGRQKVMEKYSEMGKGLKQVQQQRENLEAALKEMSKPLARYADDQDLDQHLRDAEREGDPMLDYIRSKKAKEPGTSKPKPKYEGSFLPNRFGICPGHRWDGVDRSNGFEKRWFDTQNAKKAREEEAYKWSTADM